MQEINLFVKKKYEKLCVNNLDLSYENGKFGETTFYILSIIFPHSQKM